MCYKIIFLIGMLASASALPTSNETSSFLEKRSHYGWIGSYSQRDCRGTLYGDRPEIKKGITSGCTGFSPSTDNIAINFGTATLGFNSVKFWADESCNVVVAGSKTEYSKPPQNFGCTHHSEYQGAINSVSVDG